jgi:hypothetical protein
MLQEVLDLIRRSGARPLSAAAIAGHLNLPPEMVQHMLYVLVHRGRLAPVDGCSGCDVCPLHRYCAGSDGVQRQGYVTKT